MLHFVVAAWLDAYYDAANQHEALNVAAVELVRTPKPFGAHLTLVGGESSDLVHAAEPRSAVRHIYQASVSYAVRDTTIEAGVYPSHIGFEGFFSKDNWNYTQGLLGVYSPYYQSGVKVSRPLSAHWSAQLHLLRGWQNITDPRAPKAVGTALTYGDDRTSASFNTYADSHRKFGQLIASWKATPSLSVAASLDRGRELPANWLGAGAWARYALSDRTAVAVRVERFRDPRAGITGFAQTVSERTLTFEARPSAHVIVKLEGRRDASTTQGRRDAAIASAVVTY